MNEKISQLIDQELDPGQRNKVFDRICNDDSAKNAWQCYHLIGSVIRAEVSSTGSDLSRLIEQKLDSEPTVLAPLRINKPDASQSKAVWKSAGLLAIAASLALAAVVTLAPVERDDTGNKLITGSETRGQAVRFSREFDEMLVEHAQFTASAGLNGLIAYAKLISDQQLEQ